MNYNGITKELYKGLLLIKPKTNLIASCIYNAAE